MASLLETDAKTRPLVPWYNLKRVFKAFQVWGGAFISSANDNKSFDVTTVRVWAVHYLIRLCSQ